MATEITVPMDDAALFEAATADEPVSAESAPTERSEPKADATGRLHGEQGRFVEKPAEADAAPIQQQPEETTPPKDEDGHQVPSWRLREIREERDAHKRALDEANRQAYAYQQQLREHQAYLQRLQQQPQEPPEFGTPEYFQHSVQPFVQPLLQQIQQLEAKMHVSEAERVFGTELEAFKTHVSEMAQRGDPQYHSLNASMQASSQPFVVAKQWFAQQKLMKETGGDLSAYEAKLQEKWLKDPEFVAKLQAAQQGQPPKINLPPSLNKATGASVSNAALDTGDMSNESLFKFATAPGKGRR